ncbi:MAG: M23 family peptidase, partial [Rubrivivax sp.]|nr:M23 family peptidase [Rubrivivax sp.]
MAALCTATSRAIARHPRRLTGVVAAMLLGAGSLSVASLAPDAADLEVSQVTEIVEPLPLQAQIDELAEHALRLYRSDLTRSSDSADSLLKRLGIDDPAAAAHLRSDTMARQALLGRAGRNVRVEATDDNRLLRLTARWAPTDDGTFKRLVVEKADQGFVSRTETAPLVASSRLAGGVIQSSLFAATDEARIPDAIAIQVAEIFSGDIDFHRALRKGDRFSIVYETLEGDGEPMRSGRVLSTEFVNKGKTLQAMWFQEPGASKGGYYTLDGDSMRRSYLASPMEFSRISSGFAMRFHPIQQTWRAHRGVDYAAPTGTPIRTVGDGVVE